MPTTKDRKKPSRAIKMVKKGCNQVNKHFCFLCGKFAKYKKFDKITAPTIERIRGIFGEPRLMDEVWTGKMVCRACTNYLIATEEGKETDDFRYIIWGQPAEDHSDCFICNTEIASWKFAKKIISQRGVQRWAAATENYPTNSASRHAVRHNK